MNPGHIDTNEISIRRHPKAVAAEHMAVTTKLALFADLEKVSEATALQHTAGVLLKLRRLAVFEFEDIDDSSPKMTENLCDSATNTDT
jgi:hypothetical protein